MKFEVQKELLLNGIQKIQGVITSRATLPILSHILLEVTQDTLRLTATDLDIGISCVIPVETRESGAITVPAKRFSDIIKELPSDTININTKKNNLIIIEAESCQFKILGLNKEDFPKLPEIKEGRAIKLEQADLKHMLQLTSFAVSYDETRYILNGMLLQIQDNKLTLVSTDGKRLAYFEKTLQQTSDKTVHIIIPIKVLHELSRNLQEGTLSLLVGHNQALFDLNDMIIISRLIEGEFPDYQQVIPKTSDNKMRVSRDGFLLALKRASLLTTPDYQAVKLEIFKNKLVVSKSTPDIGEHREEVSIVYQGKEIAIGFNPQYLIDVLKNLGEETIELELTDSEKPGVIRVNGYVYIVLPMRLG
ncbi:MAG: DNA polymerase III subunit beta [Candidatus Omnitrophota bacterium]|nr:MAG: DNA polymerase III subunit beta [Candidatus Omnitrophota bacterium]